MMPAKSQTSRAFCFTGCYSPSSIEAYGLKLEMPPEAHAEPFICFNGCWPPLSTSFSNGGALIFVAVDFE